MNGKKKPNSKVVPTLFMAALLMASIARADILENGDNHFFPSGGGWSPKSSVVVAFESDGSVLVNGGSAIVSLKAFIGGDLEATGTVTINGAGSTWIIDEKSSVWFDSLALSVGHLGTGFLNITDGAQVIVGPDAQIGNDTDASGMVLVEGPDSLWNIGSRLVIGGQGDGRLSIFNGAQVSASILKIGFSGHSESFIQMGGNAQLAIDHHSRPASNLTEFLDLVSGSDDIRYWNGSQ